MRGFFPFGKLRVRMTNKRTGKDNDGDSGCARMTTSLGGLRQNDGFSGGLARMTSDWD